MSEKQEESNGWSFRQMLHRSAEEYNSIICMGIDPVVEFLPFAGLDSDISDVEYFVEDIVDKMKEKKQYPGAFKLNYGFFLKHDDPTESNFDGTKQLGSIIGFLKEELPGIPILLDAKFGDIGKSSKNYAFYAFERIDADAVTISPYMGSDSVAPFTDYCAEGKGVYVLNLTSNKGSKDFQMLRTLYSSGNSEEINNKIEESTLREVVDEAMPKLYEVVAKKIASWQNNSGVGGVIGATQAELEDVIQIYQEEDLNALIPGVGSQGGSAGGTANIMRKFGYDLRNARINSSSGLFQPWKSKDVPENYAEIVVNKLAELNAEVGSLN